MTNKEKRLLAYFLDDLSETLSNRGCNDVEDSVWLEWTEEERADFVKEYHEYNGDPEEFDPKHLHIPDFCIVSLLRKKLLEESSHE